jgi:hypothetical protein
LRQVDALAGDVVLPAVVRAAQATFLVATEEQRHAAMRAELVDQADAALRVAERDQLLAEDLHPHRRAVGLGHFAGEQHRHPVAAHQLAHGGAGAGAHQQFGGLAIHLYVCLRIWQGLSRRAGVPGER